MLGGTRFAVTRTGAALAAEELPIPSGPFCAVIDRRVKKPGERRSVRPAPILGSGMIPANRGTA
jgi:hypothetical protein